MTVWVAMPAYNEAPRLPALLARWAAVLQETGHAFRLVVVDDGSTDDTAIVLRNFADEHPLEIVTHDANRGLGASLRDCLLFVVTHGADGDVVATMDADNTQPPELLPQMMQRLESNRCDVVIASRYQTGSQCHGLSGLRRFMSFGARVLFRLAHPIPDVRDYTCGYRLYRVAILRRAFEAYGERFCDRHGFECTADVLLRLARIGAAFGEVPMVLHYGEKSGASSMRVGRTVWRTLSLMLARRFEKPPTL